MFNQVKSSLVRFNLVEDHISENVEMCSEFRFKRIKYLRRNIIVRSNIVKVETEIIEDDLNNMSVDSGFER